MIYIIHFILILYHFTSFLVQILLRSIIMQSNFYFGITTLRWILFSLRQLNWQLNNQRKHVEELDLHEGELNLQKA